MPSLGATASAAICFWFFCHKFTICTSLKPLAREVFGISWQTYYSSLKTAGDIYWNDMWVILKNRPFAAKPSHYLLFIKLWAAWTLRMPRNGKSMSKTPKWPSLKNEILWRSEFFINKIYMEKVVGESQSLFPHKSYNFLKFKLV